MLAVRSPVREDHSMTEHQPHPGPSVPQWWAGTHDRGVYRRYTWALDYLHNRYNISRDGHHTGGMYSG